MRSLQVQDLNIAPLGAKIFGNQPPVALGRLFLAAQKAGFMQPFRADILFGFSCGKERQKVFFVNLPSAFVLFEIVQNLLARRQIRPMDVIHLTNRPEEIAQVVSLGKTGQLGNIVEADINHPLHTRPKEACKKFLGRFLCKSDGKQFYFVHGKFCFSSRI